MKSKYRIYRRPKNGVYYAEDCRTGARKSLGTKDEAAAERLLQARNDAHTQPALSRELAKAYLHVQDPKFGERTWGDVACLIDNAYKGPTAERFQKFLRSAPVKELLSLRLVETCSGHFLSVLSHQNAGVSTNVQLRILHNRAIRLEWILRPVLGKGAWPKIEYDKTPSITAEQHQKILDVTENQEYRNYFELLWGTGGSQTDIANLCAEDIDWPARRLYYQRQKLKHEGKGNACLVIGGELERILKKLPAEGPLFPHLRTLRESRRSNYFWTKRKKAKLPDGIVLHSYRYAWAERAYASGMPEREAMAHLGHGSKFVHRAYARKANLVTLPLEDYEKQKAQQLANLRPAQACSNLNTSSPPFRVIEVSHQEWLEFQKIKAQQSGQGVDIHPARNGHEAISATPSGGDGNQSRGSFPTNVANALPPPPMKLLLLSDIHGIPSSMEWIHGEARAGQFDMIAIAGDLIDAFAKESISDQTRRVGKWIQDLAASGTPLALCSGNHDADHAPTAEMVYGPEWLARLHRKTLLTDSRYDWVKEALLVTSCPYNYYFQEVDSWTEKLLLAGEDMRAARKAEAPWLVLHHDPPHISSMIGLEKLGASESLCCWLNTFRPDFVLSGHFHSAPYNSGFANKVQNTWCLNPGFMENAPEPNRIILDLGSREAEWIFFDSDLCKRREMRVLQK